MVWTVLYFSVFTIFMCELFLNSMLNFFIQKCYCKYPKLILSNSILSGCDIFVVWSFSSLGTWWRLMPKIYCKSYQSTNYVTYLFKQVRIRNVVNKKQYVIWKDVWMQTYSVFCILLKGLKLFFSRNPQKCLVSCFITLLHISASSVVQKVS